ncbi:MAG: ferredoxin [Candidatus Nanoarchaeia archaeon]|nr:ferredoxin [Candidatus Nanoarchaeia archaeon]MDD5587646.1 ferredoxin [Candidatus Nanoarchaeia archaeon]
MAEIKVDTNKCIGCGACAAICDNFEMKDLKGSQKAFVKKAKVAKITCEKEAADTCPVQAISIK